MVARLQMDVHRREVALLRVLEIAGTRTLNKSNDQRIAAGWGRIRQPVPLTEALRRYMFTGILDRMVLF